VWQDIVELAGGTTALTERADTHLGQDRPLEALHLLDIVLAHAPDDPAALRVKRLALESLLERSSRENFSEVQWLEQAIKAATPEESQ
jgi:hypothetical protein